MYYSKQDYFLMGEITFTTLLTSIDEIEVLRHSRAAIKGRDGCAKQEIELGLEAVEDGRWLSAFGLVEDINVGEITGSDWSPPSILPELCSSWKHWASCEVGGDFMLEVLYLPS
ncbi:unnamed protein product [Sphenostylis stenocarpa]|uniref:Uncharacterized protein n=1 Tax=Sphenostylis stenocarpa TaxID=92480 RepID=A0AA86VES3_9FABA|nr:unnamed protein product [Sphenostylis stenocarpa]